MKIILLILFLPFISKAQDLNVEQTLNYINNQLNDKNNKFFEGTTTWARSFVLRGEVNSSNLKNAAMNDYFYNIKIEKGYLIVIRSFIKHIEYQDAKNNWQSVSYNAIIEESSIPIKSIDNNFFSSFQSFNCNSSSSTYPNNFVISTKDEKNNTFFRILKLFDQTGKEIKTKKENIKLLFIEFSNSNLICDKLSTAFTHLIELAIKDPKYNHIDLIKDFDPFSNPIKKDSLISNGIIVSNTNSVPMTKIGGVYEIPVILNGALKLNFIFDAGASDVSISPDVALTLIRTGTLSEKDFLGTETYKFADGSTAKSKVFIIKEIQLGNKKVFNVRASISNSIKAPLLLGQSVLNKFGKVTIDYDKGVIIFQK